MKSRIYYSALLSMLFTSKMVLSYQPVFKDTLKVFPFDPVVVTGTRIEMPKKELPMSISIIANSVIEDDNTVQLLDIVVDNVPGLYVSQRTNIGFGVSTGAAGQISIRGVGGYPNTQVAVLIDGRPDIMGLFGHPLGDAYSLYDVEKIEVIRGPASVLYGSNAMGGAINIIPSHNQKKGFHLYAPITFGSYNTSQSFFRSTYEGNRTGYSLSAGYRNSDGYREDARDDYHAKNGNFELHSNLTDHLKLSLNSYLTVYKIYDPGQITAPSDTQVYNINRQGGDLTLKHDTKYLISEVKFHYNSGHHEIYDGFKSDDYTAGLIFTETFNISENIRLTGGIDEKQYGGKALLYGSWVDYSVNELSFYTTYYQKLINLININAGFRYASHSIVGNLFIPSVGVSAILPYRFIIKGIYSEGYRNPTINELYLFPNDEKQGPSTTDIQQETSRNTEFSIEKQFNLFLNASLTVYKTQIENLIQKAFISMPPVYQNIKDVDVTGFELEGQLLLPPRLTVNWSASSAKHSSIITESPGEKLNLAIRYKATENQSIGIQVQWINNLYSYEDPYAKTTNSANASYFRLNPYSLVDLNYNWSINSYLSLMIKINNVFDESYETIYGFPMPGRNFTIGLTAKY